MHRWSPLGPPELDKLSENSHPGSLPCGLVGTDSRALPMYTSGDAQHASKLETPCVSPKCTPPHTQGGGCVHASTLHPTPVRLGQPSSTSMRIDIHHLILAARQMRRRCDAALKAVLDRYGWRSVATYDHLLALKYIHANPGCCQADLQRHLALGTSSVGNLVKGLGAAKLVKNSRVPRGSPRVELETTDDAGSYFDVANAAVHKALTPLAEQELEDALLVALEAAEKIREALPKEAI